MEGERPESRIKLLCWLRSNALISVTEFIELWKKILDSLTPHDVKLNYLGFYGSYGLQSLVVGSRTSRVQLGSVNEERRDCHSSRLFY